MSMHKGEFPMVRPSDLDAEAREILKANIVAGQTKAHEITHVDGVPVFASQLDWPANLRSIPGYLDIEASKRAGLFT